MAVVVSLHTNRHRQRTSLRSITSVPPLRRCSGNGLAVCGLAVFPYERHRGSCERFFYRRHSSNENNEWQWRKDTSSVNFGKRRYRYVIWQWRGGARRVDVELIVKERIFELVVLTSHICECNCLFALWQEVIMSQYPQIFGLDIVPSSMFTASQCVCDTAPLLKDPSPAPLLIAPSRTFILATRNLVVSKTLDLKISARFQFRKFTNPGWCCYVTFTIWNLACSKVKEGLGFPECSICSLLSVVWRYLLFCTSFSSDDNLVMSERNHYV